MPETSDSETLLSEIADLVTQNGEKAEKVNTFASVLTSKTGLQESQVPETRGKDVILVEKDQVREYLEQTTYVSPWALMGCTHKS